MCRASKADLKVLVLDASTALPAKPSNMPWARFVFSHMASLGVRESSDVKWGEQELLQGGSLHRPLSAAPTASAGLAASATDSQHRGVVTSHSHTSPSALNSTPATDGQYRGVVTSHSHTYPGALNSTPATEGQYRGVVTSHSHTSPGALNSTPATEGQYRGVVTSHSHTYPGALNSTPATDGQYRGVVTSHSHTSPAALNSTPATDGQYRGVVTSHSHTYPGALNSKMCTSDTEHLVVATQMDKSRITASEGESEQRMYVSENMNDSRLLNSNNTKQSGMTDRPMLDPEVPISDDVIVVVNKSDLVPADSDWLLLTGEDLGVDVCLLSCTTAEGLDSFVSLLADRVKRL